jgi:hypothetical protein
MNDEERYSNDGKKTIGGSCVWIEEKPGIETCIPSKNSLYCTYYRRKEDCTIDVNNKNSIWLMDKCHEIKNRCESIKNLTICERSGVVRTDDNLIELECILMNTIRKMYIKNKIF